MDMDGNLDTGNTRTLDGDGTTGDPTAIVGTVAFQVKMLIRSRGHANNHFSAATTELTVHIVQFQQFPYDKGRCDKAMSVIDGALLMISGIRSNMGSANNRLQSTIDNLSNIAVNAQKSLSTIEDANFAEETAKLTKAQILAKAATSMLAQANKAKETMLALLQ